MQIGPLPFRRTTFWFPAFLLLAFLLVTFLLVKNREYQVVNRTLIIQNDSILSENIQLKNALLQAAGGAATAVQHNN